MPWIAKCKESMINENTGFKLIKDHAYIVQKTQILVGQPLVRIFSIIDEDKLVEDYVISQEMARLHFHVPIWVNQDVFDKHY